MSDIVVGIRLKADGSGFVGEMKLAEAELDRVSAATTKGQHAADKMATSMREESRAAAKANADMQMLRASKLGVASASASARQQIEHAGSAALTTADHVRNLRSMLLNLISVGALGGMASQAIDYADAWKLVGARIDLATGSSYEALRAQRQIFELAQLLRIPYQEAASLFARTMPAIKEFGGAQAEALLISKALGISLKVSGASTAEQASAMLQFSQALGAGLLNGEEFNAMADAAPRLLQALADGLGRPRGELKKLAEQGKLTTDLMYAAIAGQMPKLEAEMSRMPATVGGGWTKLNNEIRRAIGEMDGATGTTSQLANAIETLADNLDAVGSGLKTGIELASAYLLLFKGAPIVIGATSAALTAVVAQVRMAQLAMAIGLPASQLFWSAMNGGATGFVAASAASVAAIGALKLAMGGLFAAFVGWEIGTWLRDNFVEARVAGLAFVSVMLKGWEHLKYGANVAWEGIKSGFRGAFAAIGEFYANLYSQIASGLKTIGADGAGSSLQQFADDIRSASANTGDFAAAQAQLKAQLNANLAAIDENIQGLVDYEMGVTGSAKASDKAAAAADHLKKKKKELTDEQKKALEKIAEVKAGLEFEIAQLSRSAREQAIYNALKQAGVTIHSAAGKAIAATAGLLYDEQQAVKRAEQAYQDLINTLQGLRDEGAKHQQSMAREEKQVADLVEAAQWELQTMGLQKSAVTDLTIARLEAERASWLMWEAEVGVADAAADEIASINKKIAGYQRLRDVYQQIEQKTQTLETVKRIADGIETTFRDAIKDIVTVGKLDFDNFWKAVAISFKTQLADEIYRMTIGKIVVHVVGSFAGGAANAAGAAATAAGANPAQQGLGIVSGVQGAWSAYNGGMASMASSFATSGMGQYLGLSTAGQVMGPPTAAGAMGWTTTGATMTGAGSSMAAAAGPIAAALAAAYTLAEMNKSGWGRENTGEGYAKSMLTGGIGTNIIVDRLFGHNRTVSNDAAGIQGTIDLAGFSGQNYQEKSQKGGTFRSDRRWTDTSAVESDMDAYMDSLVRQTVSGVQRVGKALGLETENALQGFNHTFQLQLTENGSWDKAGEKISGELGKVSDELATRLLPNIVDFKRYGESASQTLTRLNAEFQGTDAILQILGKTAEAAFGAAGIASAEARERLIDFAGGMDQLATKTASFYQHYFSEEERAQQASLSAQKQLNAAFAEMGIAVPANTKAFRELTLAQDLSTEAGAKRFNQLLDLEGAYWAVQNAADQAAKAQQDAADKQKQAAQEASSAIISAMQAVTAQMDKVASYKAGISSAQFDIRSKLPGFDAVGYYRDQGATLRGQLDAATTLDQRMGLGEQLKTSILNRYQAEQEQINKTRDAQRTALEEQRQASQSAAQAQQQALQAQQQAAKQWNDSLLRMRDYAQSLLVSDASPLSPEARLKTAEAQYNAMLQRARGGDADAAGQLQGNAQAFLTAARDYYASGSGYGAIFNQVQSGLANLGAQAKDPAALDARFQSQSLAYQQQAIAQDAQWQSSYSAQSATWQQEDADLAQKAIDELDALQQQADAWNEELKTQLQEQAINGTRQTELLGDVAANTKDLDTRIAAAINAAMTALTAQVAALTNIQAQAASDMMVLQQQNVELLDSIDRTNRLESV